MMASSFRGVFRLATALRTTAVRQRTFSSVSKWRHLAAVSVSSWSTSQSRLQPHVTTRPVVPTRWFASEGITLPELESRVIDVLKAFDKIDPEKVTKDAHFVNDLGLDSLDVVEIVMAFEDEFGVEIDDERAEKIFTAQDAIEFLKKEMDVH